MTLLINWNTKSLKNKIKVLKDKLVWRKKVEKGRVVTGKSMEHQQKRTFFPFPLPFQDVLTASTWLIYAHGLPLLAVAFCSRFPLRALHPVPPSRHEEVCGLELDKDITALCHTAARTSAICSRTVVPRVPKKKAWYSEAEFIFKNCCKARRSVLLLRWRAQRGCRDATFPIKLNFITR